MIKYEGPFNPPPKSLLENAIGWRFEKTHIEPGKWKPVAWMIVYPDSILLVEYFTQMAYKDSTLFSPDIGETND